MDLSLIPDSVAETIAADPRLRWSVVALALFGALVGMWTLWRLLAEGRRRRSELRADEPYHHAHDQG